MLPGCGACADFKPRLERQVKGFQGYGVPLTYFQEGVPLGARQIPVVYLNASSVDASMQAFLNQHAIQGLPTTILMTHNARPVVLEGALDDNQIYEVLLSAVFASR